jgi:hypothetical protein
MTKSMDWRLLIAVTGLLVLPQVAAAQPVDKARLLTQSRAVYYSLASHGFAGAKCRIVPDWTVALGKPRSDPGLKTAFELLDKLQFTIAVDANGATKVERVDSTVAPNPQSETGFQQILGGLREAMEGFFTTWRLFMIDRPLPEPGQEVAITEQAAGYHLAYKDGGADVGTDMGRTGVVSRIAVRSPTFASVIDPTFTRDASGLVLAGYVADYTPNSGSGKTHLDITLTYQTDRGMKIPSTMMMDSILDGAPTKMRLDFTECQISRK